MAKPLSPEDEARINAYWGGGATGPTAQDDAEFAAFKAAQAAPAASGAPSAKWSDWAPAAATMAPPAADAAPATPTLTGSMPIDPSWGAPAPAAAGVSTPGDLFGAHTVKAPPGAPTFQAPAAPPAKSVGPTAQDDAEFAAFRAKQGGKSGPKADASATAYKGGAGKPGNPDPYGLEAARKAEVGSYDTRAHAMDRAANAQQQRDLMEAEHMANLGRFQEEDAAIARSQADYADKKFNDDMGEVNRQLDDVKSKKVDPLRLMKESPGLGIISVLGGIVGGFYQGITGGAKNQFVEDLNRQIDRGVAEDERQIRDERSAIGEKTNMLQQLRASQKDHATADMQYRNLSYEAAKAQINADAERAGTDIARAHADDAIGQINGEQAKVQQQIALAKQHAAAAAAAAAHENVKAAQAAFLAQYDKNLSSGMTPSQATDWAAHITGRVYAPGMGPARPKDDSAASGGMLTREQRGKVAMDHQEAQFASDEFNAQMEALKKHPAIGKDIMSAGVLSHLGGRLAPDSTAYLQDLGEINTRMLQAVGKVAKDADGKPTQSMQDEIKHNFAIKPGDKPELKLQKLGGVQSTVNALARQQGAGSAPKPNAKLEVERALGAKPVR